MRFEREKRKLSGTFDFLPRRPFRCFSRLSLSVLGRTFFVIDTPNLTPTAPPAYLLDLNHHPSQFSLSPACQNRHSRRRMAHHLLILCARLTLSPS